MLSALVRIIDLKSGKELPIFVYESEVNEVISDLSLGVELTEISGWTMKENRLRRTKR